MNWRETLRTGLDAVRAHRLRSVLTMVGILIGIAAVILTVGFGEGASAQIRAQISSLGTNLLIITPGSATSAGGVNGPLGSSTTQPTISSSPVHLTMAYDQHWEEGTPGSIAGQSWFEETLDKRMTTLDPARTIVAPSLATVSPGFWD